MENIEKFLEEIENNSYAFDSEADEKAINFSEVAGEIELDLPKKVLLNDSIILDQGPTMLCVAFGTTAGVNEARKLLWYKPDKNPNTLAGYIEANLDPNIRENGTLIENGPKWARKLAWLEGYTRVNSLYEIKKSLAFGLPIATGTNKLSWTATKKNNYIATLGKGGGHFIHIPGYDDELELVGIDGREYKGALIVENTWGEVWGDKGYYYIPYEIALDVLFNTKLSLIINKAENRKYMEEILANLNKKMEENKIAPVVPNYEYFNGEDKAITDPENKNLFLVLQNALKETGYKPIFRTIIGSNEDRTNTRILLEISNARNYGNRNT